MSNNLIIKRTSSKQILNNSIKELEKNSLRAQPVEKEAVRSFLPSKGTTVPDTGKDDNITISSFGVKF